MKHRIKQVELTDGKHLFYPTDRELIGLDIKTFVIEETMTKEEYERKFGYKHINKEEYDKLRKIKLNNWYCPKCDKYHDLHHVCEMLAK